MQKVYLLLRSNKQTGPYSLEELLELNLKPFDLVWVDGRSAAWQYPSEVPALKPYVCETPQSEAPHQPIATAAMEENVLQIPRADVPVQPANPIPLNSPISKRVFVSVPKNISLEKDHKTFAGQNSLQEHEQYMPPVSDVSYERKDEVKPVTSSYSKPYENLKPSDDNSTHTNYSRPLQEVEEDYTNWVYKQKRKKKTSVKPKDLALAVLILAVIGGGYYVMSKPSVANSVLPTNNKVAQNPQLSEQKISEVTKQNDVPEEQQMPVNAAHKMINDSDAEQSKNIKTKNRVIVSQGQTNSSVPQIQNSMPVEKTTPNIQIEKENPEKQPEERQQPQQTAPVEKKKKLGEVIKGIFSKKEKNEDVKDEAPVVDDPKPANNRHATRRDESNRQDEKTGTNEINTASLMEQVDLSSNAPENWMMGVKNLKITLKNRSNVTLQAASVTVSYYNENNDLLEKKLIYFGNVGPKSKATIAAPDHKFADHVDFKLTTVSAKEDRYASY